MRSTLSPERNHFRIALGEKPPASCAACSTVNRSSASILACRVTETAAARIKISYPCRSDAISADPSRAVEREPSTGHDHMHVRMMGEGRAPGVQHGGDADPGAEAPGIGGDGERRLGRRLHQEVVDHALVLVGDVAQLARQRVDDVKVWDGQQFRFAVGQPSARRRSLALRTMPVTARVESDVCMAARRVLAACDVAAERRSAAALDSAHHLQLVEAHVAAVGLAPGGTVLAEDVREFQNRPKRRYRAGGFSAFRVACLWRGAVRRASGLSILEIIPVATRV